MKILIIGNGVGHNVQLLRTQDDPLDEPKRKFEIFLREQIAICGPNFIGEEALENEETIAGKLGYPWANIDMPAAVRESAGIAEEQLHRPRFPKFLDDEAKTQLTKDGYERDVGGGWVDVEARVPSDTVREQYMVERIAQDGANATNVIVICGIAHSEVLREKLQEIHGDCVQVKRWE